MKINQLKTYLKYLLLLIALAYVIKSAFRPGDFKVFLEASKMVRSGESPYNYWIFVSEGITCQYYYSPLWTIILLPFTFIPPLVTNLIWLLLNAFFVYRIYGLLTKYLGELKLSAKTSNLIVLITIIFSLRFLLLNFDMIQMTIFLLWGGLESLKLFEEKRMITASLLLALIINVKLLPIVILPYLLYRGQFKAFLMTSGFSVIFLFVPALFVGFEFNQQLLSDWWYMINPSNKEHVFETGIGSNGLTSLLPTLFMETKGTLDVSRNFLSLNEEAVGTLVNFTRLLFAGSTLIVLANLPFRKAKNSFFELREITYLFMMIPLIFPHQQKYALLLCAPASFYLAFYLLSPQNKINKMKRWMVSFFFALAFMLMTLTTDGLIGRTAGDLAQHFNIITWGAISLTLAVLLASPNIEFRKSKNDTIVAA